MLKLPDVTLVAVDTSCHDLTALALHECLNRVEFGDVLVLSDRPILPDTNAHLTFAGKTAYDAERAIWHMVPHEVKTSHFLWVQWDSWVIDPSQWTDEFLAYDYIGAPWWHQDGCNVGNGGFSLRSVRLMQYLASHQMRWPFRQPEDATLCRGYRAELELDGYQWAPEPLAYQFSFERVRELFHVETAPGVGHSEYVKTFGFHGMFNWPQVLTRDQIQERLTLAPRYVLEHGHCREMRANMEALKAA